MLGGDNSKTDQAAPAHSQVLKVSPGTYEDRVSFSFVHTAKLTEYAFFNEQSMMEASISEMH